MTPTHAISADEARRLLTEDRFASAKRFLQSHCWPPPDISFILIETPFGTYPASRFVAQGIERP